MNPPALRATASHENTDLGIQRLATTFGVTFIRKRQRTAAVQDASEGQLLPCFRQVLDCASLWRFGFPCKNGFMAAMRVQSWTLKLSMNKPRYLCELLLHMQQKVI